MNHPRSPWAGRAALVLLAAFAAFSTMHCGGDSAGGDPGPPGAGAVSGTPAQFEPSDPGYLDVRPNGRVLLPGQAVNAGTWSTVTPVVSEVIGRVDPPEEGNGAACEGEAGGE